MQTPAPTPRRVRGNKLQVNVTLDERDRLWKLALADGRTISSYVHRLIQRHLADPDVQAVERLLQQSQQVADDLGHPYKGAA
jgi:predicted DNA-binding protein